MEAGEKQRVKQRVRLFEGWLASPPVLSCCTCGMKQEAEGLPQPVSCG